MAKILAYTRDGKHEKIDAIIAMQGNPREAALLGYMAGIMDGEGTIGIKRYMPKGKNRTMCYFVYLSMGMQNKEVPELFRSVFGGSLNEERVQRPTSMWRWNATGKLHIKAILGVLMPYLRVKREQAELAMKCFEEWDPQDKPGRFMVQTSADELLKREEAYWEMRKLKHQEHPQRLNELTLETAKR